MAGGCRAAAGLDRRRPSRGPCRLRSCRGAFAAKGYSTAPTLPSDPGFDHAHVWTAPDRLPIELHWTIVGADERRCWDVLADETETAQVAGELVEIPNEAARCLIVALHAAQHGAGAAQTLHDLERALTTAGEDVWVRSLELAVAVGAETPFVAGLDLTARGHALRNALGLRAPALTDSELRALLTAPTARGFWGLSRHPSAPAKARFLLAKLFPAPGFMRLRYPVARTARQVLFSRTCIGCGGWPAGQSRGCAPGGGHSGTCATAGRATSRRPPDAGYPCARLFAADSRPLRERGVVTSVRRLT